MMVFRMMYIQFMIHTVNQYTINFIVYPIITIA